MDIQTSKIELTKLILGIENKKVIDKIINLIKSEQSDFWNDLSPNEKDEIQLGINQLNAGKRVSLEEFIKRVS
ncbi:MAG: hypothetical protein R2728_01595 [Chitinophagales bacterium]